MDQAAIETTLDFRPPCLRCDIAVDDCVDLKNAGNGFAALQDRKSSVVSKASIQPKVQVRGGNPQGQ